MSPHSRVNKAALKGEVCTNVIKLQKVLLSYANVSKSICKFINKPTKGLTKEQNRLTDIGIRCIYLFMYTYNHTYIHTHIHIIHTSF